MTKFPFPVEFIDQTAITFDDRPSIVVPTGPFNDYMEGLLTFEDAFAELPALSDVDYETLRSILEVEEDFVQMSDGAGGAEGMLSEMVDMQDQAIDAFMDERDTLLDELREQHLMTRILANEIEQDRAEMRAAVDYTRQLEDMLVQAADYVGKAKALLERLGVVVGTDQNGDPVVVTNPGTPNETVLTL